MLSNLKRERMRGLNKGQLLCQPDFFVDKTLAHINNLCKLSS